MIYRRNQQDHHSFSILMHLVGFTKFHYPQQLRIDNLHNAYGTLLFQKSTVWNNIRSGYLSTQGDRITTIEVVEFIIDVILIHGKTCKKHDDRLDRVFRRIQESGPIFTKVRRHSRRRRSYDKLKNKVTNLYSGIHKATRRRRRKIPIFKSTNSADACALFTFILMSSSATIFVCV